jgi:hypothetical protein
MRTTRHRSGPRVVIGLILIAVGLHATLDNLGLSLDLERFADYWPVFIILVGALRLYSGNQGSGLFVMFLGGVLLWPAFLPETSRREFLEEHWPLLMIAFGMLLVLRSFGGRFRAASSPNDSQYVSTFGILSTQRWKLTSQDFRGGDLVAFLGGCEIDLTHAGLADEGAVIEIFAFWGGVTIKVPRHWIVDLQALTVMGGSEDKAHQDPVRTGPRLIVKGFVMMGGVEVSN